MATIVLEIDGYQGECRIVRHQGCLDAVAIFDSLEVPVPQQSSGAAGRTVGRSRMADIEVVRYVDSASPSLANACSAVKHIGKASIHLFRMLEGQPEKYMSYALYDSYITRVERSTEDAAGTVYGPHFNDSGSVIPPSSNAGAAPTMEQLKAAINGRPVPRPALPGTGSGVNPVQVERLWFRSASVGWFYYHYEQGVFQGNFNKGWNFEEGAELRSG